MTRPGIIAAKGVFMFAYRSLTADIAPEWKDMFARGARDFPLGFVMTPDEVEALPIEKCQSLLDAGGLRGVFDRDIMIGFCGYQRFQPARTRHRGKIGPFFVTLEFHGSGAAQALMGGVIAEARASGVVQLELTVAGENRRAIAFYERQGFIRYGAHPDDVRMDGGGGRSSYLYLLRL